MGRRRKGRKRIKGKISPMARDAASSSSRLVPPGALHNPHFFNPMNQIKEDDLN